MPTTKRKRETNASKDSKKTKRDSAIHPSEEDNNGGSTSDKTIDNSGGEEDDIPPPSSEPLAPMQDDTNTTNGDVGPSPISTLVEDEHHERRTRVRTEDSTIEQARLDVTTGTENSTVDKAVTVTIDTSVEQLASVHSEPDPNTDRSDDKAKAIDRGNVDDGGASIIDRDNAGANEPKVTSGEDKRGHTVQLCGRGLLEDKIGRCKIMPAILAVSAEWTQGRNVIMDIPKSLMDKCFQKQVIDRIYQFVSYSGTAAIRTPQFSNLALADPSDYKVSDGYICPAGSGTTPANFFLTGVLTSFAKNQLCMMPAAQTVARSVALLGAWYGQDKLFFNSWEGGLSFRTGFRNQAGFGKGGYSSTFPIKSSVLQKDADVPIYNGTAAGFNAGKWWDSVHAHREPLAVGSAVMAFFSVRKYDYTGKVGNIDGLNDAIGLSLLAIVLVSDRWDAIKATEYVDLQDDSFGVDGVRSVEELQVVEDAIM